MNIKVNNANYPNWKDLIVYNGTADETVYITSVSKVMNISVENINLLLKKAGAPIRDTSNKRLNKTQLEILSQEYVRGLKKYYSKTIKHIHQFEKSEIEDFESFYSSYYIIKEQQYDNEGCFASINTLINSLNQSIDGSILMPLDLLNRPEKISLSLSMQSDDSALYLPSEKRTTFQNNGGLPSWDEFDTEALRQTFYDLLRHENPVLLDDIECSLHPSIFDLIREVKTKKKKTLMNIIKHRFFKIRTKVKNKYKVILSIMTIIIISCRYYIFANDNDEHSKVALFASFE